MEIYNDWLVSKMTRSELNELSEEERKERLRLQKKKSRENNKETISEANKKYRENHPEYSKEYYQSPTGKKCYTLSSWKFMGLQETKEDLEWIYELYLTQELCYSCDCILTRNGDNSQDQACMDHDHITNKFRQICCRSCNSNDSWMKYWC